MAGGNDTAVRTRGVFDECLAFVETIGFPKERILNHSGHSFLNFLKGKNKLADLSGLDPLFENRRGFNT